jgi:putative Mn2+ efflux pump MntP
MSIPTLGLDNIAVAFALGPLGLGWRRIGLLGVIFGVAEAGMALLGTTAGGFVGPSAATITEAAHAGALATIAVALIGLAWIKCRPADIVANPWALLGMSLLLGIDNFIAGRLDDPVPSFASLATAGMLTGALAAAACAAGNTLFPLAPRSGAMVSGLMLAGLAIAGMA